MDLSICILTHQQPELLPRCVACCFSEIEKAGIAGEIIVIDNASTDGSPARVAALFPGVRVLRNEENLGFAAANNGAIRVSRGRDVMILNDDALLQEGSLRCMLQKLASCPRVGMAGPKLLNLDGSPQANFTNLRFPRLRHVLCEFLRLNLLFARNATTRKLFTLWKDLDSSGEAEHLAGACLLVRRAVLDQVGMFDEGFPFWYEDTDLCYRIREAGWQVFYLEEARVIHYGSASTKQWTPSQKTPIFFKSLTHYFGKHSGFATSLLLRLFLFAGVLVKAFIAALRHLTGSSSNPAGYRNSMSASLKALRVLVSEWS